MEKERIITADMSIAEVLKRFPKTEETLAKYKLHCVGCEVASIETIAVGAETHGIKDLEALLDDLNSVARN
jgi:hybrid cluster-associated redox disulfide protein